MGTRTSLSNSSTCVLCSRLLFNIKSTNEIRNGKLLSLVFQGSSKIVPRRWKLGNDASGNKFVRQHTLEVLKFFCERLYLMSLLYNRALISHLVVIELLHDVQLAAGVRGTKLGLERSPHVLAVVKRHIRIHN